MKRLHSLDAAEISLVPRGANKKKFLVFKSDGDSKMTKEQQKLLEAVGKVDPKIMEKIEKAMKSLPGMNDQKMTALKAMARIAMPFKGKMTKADLEEHLMHGLADSGFFTESENVGDPGEGKAGHKHETDGGPKMASATWSPEPIESEHEVAALKSASMAYKSHMEKAQKSSKAEEKEEDKKDYEVDAMKAANCAYKSHLEKLGYQMYPPDELKQKSLKGKPKDGEPKEEKGGHDVEKHSVLKSDGTLDLSAVPEAVRPIVELIYKGQRDAVAKAADLEKELTHERNLRKQKEFVAKAASFKGLGIKTDELATTLFECSEKLPKEVYEKVEKLLTSVNKQAESSSLFAELGSNQEATGSHWDRIEAAAAGMVQKSGEKLTKEQSIEKFLETREGQQMYQEYKAERKGGI